MARPQLHPLRFEPIYQYRPWGGRRLGNWLKEPLPGDGLIGEAWLLSDRDDFPSRVADGPLKGHTIAELMKQSGDTLLGKFAPRFNRFPLLLKLLDVSDMLSVQVHPPDERLDLIPKGETGKTEAWVVLEAEPGSRAYVGLKPGTTAADLRTLSSRTVDDCLTGFTPVRGQGILIEAGVVHALGEGVVVFEVQENSDVTFRLYDWDRIDPRSGLPRALQVEQAIDCVDFSRIVIQPEPQAIEATSPTLTRPFLDCPQFKLWRIQSTTPFHVGIMNIPRILVCIEGGGNIEYAGSDFPMEKGAVVLLPAVVGSCRFRPESHVTLLEIALPDHA